MGTCTCIQSPGSRKSGRCIVPVNRGKASNAGYILLLDSHVLIFYTNDLCGNPKKNILTYMDVNSTNVNELVYGLGTLYRWTGTKSLQHKKILVPSPILDYNKYMNEVNVVDQICRTNIMARKVFMIFMSFFTMVLDLTVNNVFSLYKWVLHCRNSTGSAMNYMCFKCLIAIKLCDPLCNTYTVSKVSTTSLVSTMYTSILDRPTINFTSLNKHILLPVYTPPGSKESKHLWCYFYGASNALVC